jgi:hypothetical protein
MTHPRYSANAQGFVCAWPAGFAANDLALDGLHRHLSTLASYNAAAATVDMNRWGESPISFSCFPNQFEAGSIDAKLGINPVRHVYIIRNGYHNPEFKVVKATVWA